MINLANSTTYDLPILMDPWQLPPGAFGESDGPTWQRPPIWGPLPFRISASAPIEPIDQNLSSDQVSFLHVS